MNRYLPYIGYFLWSFLFITVLPEQMQAQAGASEAGSPLPGLYWIGVVVPGTHWLCRRADIKNCWTWTLLAFFIPFFSTIYFLYKYRKVVFLTKAQLADLREEERIAANERQLALNKEADIRLKAIEDLENGRRPTFDGVPGDFLVGPKDFPLFYLDGVKIQTLKTSRKMVGGSRGASIRVAKGLTLHVGGVEGRSENIKVAQDLGRCQLLFTNSYIFVRDQMSQVKRFPRANVVGLKEYADGCSVDLTTGNPLLIFTSSVNVSGIKAAAAYEES